MRKIKLTEKEVKDKRQMVYGNKIKIDDFGVQIHEMERLIELDMPMRKARLLLQTLHNHVEVLEAENKLFEPQIRSKTIEVPDLVEPRK